MHLFVQIKGDSWKKNIVLASVSLWKCDENNVTVANASACLIDYNGGRFILSIAHGTIAESEWRVEVKGVDEDNGELGTLQQPVNMQSIAAFRFREDHKDFTEPRIVDFTYHLVADDFSSIHTIGYYNDGTLIQGARTVFAPDVQVKPSHSKKYGFFGNTRFGGVEGRRIIFQPRLEDNLRYLGNKEGHLVFKLPGKYGSHASFRGCSGAPIIDEDNKLAALVSFGEASTNCIYGVDIAKYFPILQTETL